GQLERGGSARGGVGDGGLEALHPLGELRPLGGRGVGPAVGGVGFAGLDELEGEAAVLDDGLGGLLGGDPAVDDPRPQHVGAGDAALLDEGFEVVDAGGAADLRELGGGGDERGEEDADEQDDGLARACAGGFQDRRDRHGGG